MRRRWVDLVDADQAVYRASVAFLNGRLAERATVEWALKLKPIDTVMRMALLDVIDSPAGQMIDEPWRSAWRLIEEYWNNPVINDSSTGAYDAQHRLRAGDRSGPLVRKIVELVAPRLNVEAFTKWDLQYRQPPRRPKAVTDLFSVGLTSGKILDPDLLELYREVDPSFLLSLGLALDGAVANGLDIARRLGWSNEGKLWQLGELYRVYYVPAPERAEGDHEPDEFHRGIAPAVKLLHAVVARLVDIDSPAATELVNRWKLSRSPIHLRLWAAISRDSRVAPANEVGAWLTSLDDSRFWGLHGFPEISELRARRFVELEPADQATLTARIKKGPPRSQLPRLGDRNRVEQARYYWAVRELRRIEVAGGVLPPRDKAWMDAMSLRFPGISQMTCLDEGFAKSPRAQWVPPSPDNRYDLLTGEERLKALEVAFSSGRRGWDDNPAEGATDWISQPGNPVRILGDLESVPAGGAAFGRVWERFGWAHSPAPEKGDAATQRDLPAECARVLSLLSELPEVTIRRAISGISHWISAWEKQVMDLREGPSVWLKVWPIAVEATNAEKPHEEETILNTVAQSSDDREPEDLDTLNTPAGKLVGVFLAGCPKLQTDKHPFDVDGTPRRMRDAIATASGRAGLIARHRMTEFLSYFLCAAPDWTKEHLVSPLIAETSEATALWRAIARRTRFSDVLMIIGNAMVARVTDRRLGRETRRSLVFSLIIECLHAFLDQRQPAVPYASIQQMIRSLDDEVRAYGAQAVQRFVRDVSAQRNEAPEQIFRSAAVPFLQQVWPQERSLATPGVSQALADLPATARHAFAEAVDIIERFLVPFDCWSMIDYGLYGDENGRPKISSIDNSETAAAFIRLLDRTIGTTEGSVIPHDLADALDQVRRVAPSLAESQEFRRLATAARRA